MVGRYLLVVALLAVLAFGLAARGRGGADQVALPPGTWSIVRRAEVAPSILVPGDVFSRKRTTIHVEVENMRPFRPTGGRRWRPPGASTILWIVNNGAEVKKGDLLCRLDASWFEDELRAQEIEAGRAAAERARAELTLEIAHAELRTFDEGDRPRQESQNRTSVALAQTTRSRAVDREAWVGRMFGLGYAANAEVTGMEAELMRAEVDEDRARTLQDVYVQYTAPRIHRLGEVLIEQAVAEVAFAREQDKIEQDRLTSLRKQIEHCTITAPHDGEVIYADIWGYDDYQIREGADVYQGQELFYLPERGTMAVQAVVPEDQALRVRAGQEAVVRIGAYPDRVFKGKVEVIEAQPVPNWKRWDDMPIFYATIAVEDPNRLLFNEMSASIEIRTAPAEERLVVPSEAVLVKDEVAYCDVWINAGWSRRAVETAPASWDQLEVRSGLEEGDRVRLRPWDAGGHPAATPTAHGG